MTAYLHETGFSWGATPLEFGAGAVDEIGHELVQQGAHAQQRLLAVAPRTVHDSDPATVPADSMENR